MNEPVGAATALGAGWEARVVATLERGTPDLRVVRRCADLPELVAAAAAGEIQVAFVGGGLRRLDHDVVGLLTEAGVALVGVRDPADPDDAQLAMVGIATVVPADADGPQLAAAVSQAVTALRAPGRAQTGYSDPGRSLRPLREQEPVTALPEAAGEGMILAVWGAPGSPGRSAVAATLAHEFAACGKQSLLVDLDTYAASQAQAHALLDEVPGLAAACRTASAGALDSFALAGYTPLIGQRLRILTGISRAERWPEIGAASLQRVLAACRALADWTVLDCAHPVEADEELSYDTLAPRRNAATLTALSEADVVLVVGAGDPVGLQRLVRSLDTLAELQPVVRPVVVVNKVRASAVGSGPQAKIESTLARFAGVREPVMVPHDLAGFDQAMLVGRCISEEVPNSPARKALTVLAGRLIAEHAPPARRPI